MTNFANGLGSRLPFALHAVAAALAVLRHFALAVLAAAAVLATAGRLAVLRRYRHGALVRGFVITGHHVLVRHGIFAIFRRHIALAVLAAATPVFAAASHLAVGLVVVTAGAGLGVVARGRWRGLGHALGHQGQGHDQGTQNYQKFRFHSFLRIRLRGFRVPQWYRQRRDAPS